MATVEEMITSLPTVGSASMSDIIYAVQGYGSPTSLGLSVQETLGQVFSLFQSNMVLVNSGNPNGVLSGTTYQFCWDQINSILYVCVTSGTTTTAVWERANINSGYSTTPTAAATTNLTVLSTYWQFFTGITTQTVVMPVENTCAPGMTWAIVNNSTGVLNIESSGLNSIVMLAAGEVALITCVSNSGTSASSWNSIVTAVGGGVTSITGTANQVIASAANGAVVLSTPQNIAPTSSPTFQSLSLTTALGKASGGTGSATVVTSPTATQWAGWDANKNMSANNFIEGFTTTVAAAGTTVIVVGSTYWQYFTGTTTQTVTMPVTSTLVQGQAWEFVNLSTGIVTVQSSGGNTITAMAPNTSALFTCILTTGTTAASWNSDYSLNTVGVSSITGTANQVIASGSVGSITLSLPQNIGTTNTPTFAAMNLTNPYIPGSGGLHSIQVLSSGTAATYTKPANVSSIYVEIWGAGGGGGGGSASASQNCTSGGGGAGGYATLFVPSAAATYTYTVGIAGTSGANSAGGTGGTTTFSASSLQATGGAGGAQGTSAATTSVLPTLGGAGGIGSNGNVFNAKGSAGQPGLTLLVNNLSGAGGNTIVGAGGLASATVGAGVVGQGFGSGGSGSISSNASNFNGGPGTGGLIVVWEYA